MEPGVFWILLLAAFTHALWNVLARRIKGNAWVMTLAILLASPLPMLWDPNGLATAIKAPAGIHFIALLSGVFHGIYFHGLASAYKKGDISTVYPMVRGLAVLIVALGGTLLFGELLWGVELLAVIFVALGVFLMALPGIKHWRSGSGKVLQATFTAGLGVAAFTLTDKQGAQHFAPAAYGMLMFFYTGLLQLIYLGLSRAGRMEMKTALSQTPLAIPLLGLGIVGTYHLILHCYPLAPVALVSAIRESSVVLGALMGFAFLKERLTPTKLASISLIVLGLLLLQ